jgi:Glycosyltransferase Family 4
MKTRRVLMIAYHFPPLAGSSGIQRTLRFVRYLPEFGWEPIVLTAHPRAYERNSDDQLADIPEGVIVVRAPAFDAARHFAVAGRYPGFLARPDRWVSWLPGAVWAGRKLIRKYRPHALWSTYPIATAHLIGHALHRASGLPWIADFRDPMAQEGYPADPKTWASFKRIEETTFKSAASCTFTTPSAVRMYRERYPETPAERTALIENGYDEDSFVGLEASAASKGSLHPGKLTLLHSGIVYPSERDPTQLFRAMGALLKSGRLNPTRFVLRLRATAHDDWLKSLAAEHGITDMIELAPPLPYREALEEMLRTDGLLVLQADNCNAQIPAKLYEYLRCRRPILGLTDPVGDTAEALRQAGCDHIARLDSSKQIAEALLCFLGDLDAGVVLGARQEANTSAASRRNRTKTLAKLLDVMAEL